MIVTKVIQKSKYDQIMFSKMTKADLIGSKRATDEKFAQLTQKERLRKYKI